MEFLPNPHSKISITETVLLVPSGQGDVGDNVVLVVSIRYPWAEKNLNLVVRVTLILFKTSIEFKTIVLVLRIRFFPYLNPIIPNYIFVRKWHENDQKSLKMNFENKSVETIIIIN